MSHATVRINTNVVGDMIERDVLLAITCGSSHDNRYSMKLYACLSEMHKPHVRRTLLKILSNCVAAEEITSYEKAFYHFRSVGVVTAINTQLTAQPRQSYTWKDAALTTAYWPTVTTDECLDTVMEEGAYPFLDSKVNTAGNLGLWPPTPDGPVAQRGLYPTYGYDGTATGLAGAAVPYNVPFGVLLKKDDADGADGYPPFFIQFGDTQSRCMITDTVHARSTTGIFRVRTTV